MPIQKKVSFFNKYVTNRIILPFAGWLPPFAEVTHTGRRSERVYRTPVLAFPNGDGFVLVLTYGRDVDYDRNKTSRSRSTNGLIGRNGSLFRWVILLVGVLYYFAKNVY